MTGTGNGRGAQVFALRGAMRLRKLWHWVWSWAGAVPVRYKVIGIVVSSQLVLGLGIAWWVQTALGQWLSYLLEEERVVQAMNAGTRGVIFVTAFGAIGGLLLAWLLTVALTTPLRQMAALMRKVGQGNLGVRAPVWADDEFGDLARSFNRTLDALAESRAALVTSNNDLSLSNDELLSLWEDLKRKEEMRVNLLARAVSAQEEERLRLSRELHDGTGQMLATALVNLKVLERMENPEARRTKIAELREILVQTLEECRRLSMDLRPAGLDDLGLGESLDWLAREFERNSGVVVKLKVEGDGSRLARPVELELYRIAQEMLANVAKHSRATLVTLTLDLGRETATLTVADDGIGFDAAAAMARFSRGLGLLSMRERTELLGGTFNLDSAPDRGTRIRVAVPATREVTV